MRDCRDLAGEPRRQLVLAAIEERPGSCFREVVRATGIAAGTAAHHLRILKRRGDITETTLGLRRLFFAGPGRPPSGRDCLLLREPALTAICDWVAANPGRPQKALVAAMAPVAASVTQHRLKRLVAAGVVEERPGWGRCHALHVVPVERVPGLPGLAQLGNPLAYPLGHTKACSNQVKATHGVVVPPLEVVA